MKKNTEKIICNAKVYVRRGEFAQAVLIRGGRISAVGAERDITAAASPHSERIDAHGRLVLPGFYDSHLHLIGIGRMAHVINFSGFSSLGECIAYARAEIACKKPPPGIIRGDGLNQETFITEKRFPTRDDLDAITVEQPLFITRVCGHIGFCNSAMLELLGIDGSSCGYRSLYRRGYEPPCSFAEGAERDESGRPNGILRGACLAQAREMLPAETDDMLRDNLAYAMRSALEHGVTAVGSCDIIQAHTFQRIVTAYRAIYDAQTPNVRITLQNGVADDPDYLDWYIQNGYGTGRALEQSYLKIGALKLFADGSLGARTACMKHPYRDDPSGGYGVPETDWALLRELIKKAHKNGMQVIVHAIGDAAIEEVITDFEALGDPRNTLRHGIVHCQITDTALLSRIARNNLLAVVQPIFLANDLYIVENRVGAALASSSYAWGSMERLGVRASYGTDAPVEPINPLYGIACAVTRKDLTKNYPEHGFYPEECVDVYTAVDNYTRGGAYAHFDENRLGRIKSGYAADMVLLDKDIFTIPPHEIPSARVVWTMINGERVFERL
ncbi:MAG: amidohydrolase [Treponema sp.]|jgi:predicted amidohydrolase YtcJ|nr:amidohydrolase [Treponema sp.]